MSKKELIGGFSTGDKVRFTPTGQVGRIRSIEVDRDWGSECWVLWDGVETATNVSILLLSFFSTGVSES